MPPIRRDPALRLPEDAAQLEPDRVFGYNSPPFRHGGPNVDSSLTGITVRRHAGPVVRASHLELNLGSNSLRNTNGIIKLQGREQLVIEYSPPQIILTMDFYDGGGAHVAHLRRNRWAFNAREQFVLQTSSPAGASFSEGAWLRILERQSGTVVLEITAHSSGRLDVVNGRFCTHQGDVVELTPHLCRVGKGLTLFGDVRECRGGAVILG